MADDTATALTGASVSLERGGALSEYRLLPRRVKNALGMTFVVISAGRFQMGSPVNEAGRDADEPLHPVRLSQAFFIQTTPVTQSQWRAVMGANPSRFQDDRCPVHNVSWFDAGRFIRTLNQMDAGYQYQLPTEGQWEFACRAKTHSRYASGKLDEDLSQAGWYADNSGLALHRVAQKNPNAFGLFDMHGNVWEWCADRYGLYPETPTVDPKGPEEGHARVVRGGSWIEFAWACRSASRAFRPPEVRAEDIGFRLVLKPPLAAHGV